MVAGISPHGCGWDVAQRLLGLERWILAADLNSIDYGIQITFSAAYNPMAISWKNTSVSLDIPVWPATWQPEWAVQQAQNNQPIVALNSDVTPQILAHLSQAHTEQGGLLLGRIWRSELHSTALVGLVEICQPVPAPATDSSALSLTMDASVWEASRLICAQSPTPLRVVGWYHSHPNLTAFFSHTDRQTQAAFFSNAFSVGWVIDPFNTDRDGSLNEAFFIGPQSLPINVFRMP